MMKSNREKLIEAITDFGAMCYRHGQIELDSPSMRTIDNDHALRAQAMAQMRALISGVELDSRVPIEDERGDEMARVMISLRSRMRDE